MSEDPIGFNGQDFNLYRYVKNRPLIYRDPSGLHQNSEASGGIPDDGTTAVWIQIGFGECVITSFNNAFYSDPKKQIPVQIVDPDTGNASVGTGCVFVCSGVMGYGACKKIEPKCENNI